MKRKNLMGTLLSTFRFEREKARTKAIDDLWDRNKMKNATKRGGHEIREQAINGADGTTTMHVSLWKKIDEKVIRITANVEAEEVKAETEDVKDLLK